MIDCASLAKYLPITPSSRCSKPLSQPAIPTLNDIKNKCNVSCAQGLPYPTLDAYIAIVKAATQIQDKENIDKNRSASRNVQVNAHDLQDFEFYDDYERETYYHSTQDDVEHDIDTPIQDLQAYRAQQTFGKKKFFNRVSIDRETWNTLESQDKAAWDTLSTAAKAKILNGTLKRAEEHALTCKPVSSTYSKLTAKTPIANTRSANVNETHNGQEEEVHEAPPEEPSPNLGSFSHDILDTKLLINFAKSKLSKQAARKASMMWGSITFLIRNTLIHTMYLYSYESSSAVSCFYLRCGLPRSEACLPFYIQLPNQPHIVSLSLLTKVATQDAH
jgi:hypothetical protein